MHAPACDLYLYATCTIRAIFFSRNSRDQETLLIQSLHIRAPLYILKQIKNKDFI